MKTTQRLCFAVLLLIVLFPPVVAVSRSGYRSNLGHRFLLNIPAGDNYVDFRVDSLRWAGFAMAACAVFVLGSVAFKQSD